MRSRFTRHLRHLTLPLVVVSTVGALVGTTGVLAGTVGLPLGTSAACGCEAIEEPTLSEELEEVKGECNNMTVAPPDNRCVFTLTARKDEIEIEEGRFEEEAGKMGRYEKSPEGCKKGVKLKEGVKEKEACLDVIKVKKEEAGKDSYCVLYKNEVTGKKGLKRCGPISIK